LSHVPAYTVVSEKTFFKNAVYVGLSKLHCRTQFILKTFITLKPKKCVYTGTEMSHTEYSFAL
jgi:hypothetical protein